jgi:hypothetical protein
VIPSASLASAPAFVSSSAVQIVGRADNLNVNGNGLITATSPGTLMYVAADSSNLIHVYGLNLSNASSSAATPTPVQVGNLSLALVANAALSTVICPDSSKLSASANILDPTTLFVVLHVAGTTGCNTSGDTWEVVHYGDSASTAPVAVTSLTTNSTTPAYFRPLYQPSGPLSGLVALDGGSGKLQLFADATFTNPTVLAPNVTSISDLFDSNSPVSGAAVAGTTLFFSLTTSTGTSVYRLPYSATTATQIYTVLGTLGTRAVADDGNVYFTDTATQNTGPSLGSFTVSGTLTLGGIPPNGSPLGTSSGTGTAVLDTATPQLTLTETTTNDEGSTGGTQKVDATDVFTGTYANGTFTATGGTYSFTNCQNIQQTNCSSVPLNSPDSYKTVTGSVSVTGGSITIDRVSTGVHTDETYTFAPGSAGGPATVEYVLQVPLTGGTPTRILASSTTTGYQLLGANNALVTLYTSSGNASALYTIPANASSPASSATSLGSSSYVGTVGTSFLQQASVGDTTSSLLFLNVVNSASTPATYASEVLSPDGTVKQPLTNNSSFLVSAASPQSGSVIQVQNMGGTGYDGGTFYNVDAAGLAGALGGTPLTMTGGAAYTVPSGTTPVIVGLANSLSGGFLQPASPGNTVGLALDLTGNLIVPIGTSLTNTSVTLAQ